VKYNNYALISLEKHGRMKELSALAMIFQEQDRLILEAIVNYYMADFTKHVILPAE
jgi:hypothetical protein